MKRVISAKFKEMKLVVPGVGMVPDQLPQAPGSSKVYDVEMFLVPEGTLLRFKTYRNDYLVPAAGGCTVAELDGRYVSENNKC